MLHVPVLSQKPWETLCCIVSVFHLILEVKLVFLLKLKVLNVFSEPLVSWQVLRWMWWAKSESFTFGLTHLCWFKGNHNIAVLLNTRAHFLML